MNCSCLSKGYAEGHYVLPPLPYNEAALEPLISAETMQLHYHKHHAAYVAGANAAADTLQQVAAGELPPEAAAAATQNLAFNLGGHILHCLYWGNLSPEPQGTPGGQLADAINRHYGSYQGFLRLFLAVTVAVQGSGWGVMGMDLASRRLLTFGICRHQDAFAPGFRPLLVCDVWEHAYYLTWRNNRKGYAEAMMERINWKAVENRYKDCCHEC